MKRILLAVSPYEWDVHSVLITEDQLNVYRDDSWEVHSFRVDPKAITETLQELTSFFELLSDTNFQGDIEEIKTLLMEVL